MTRRRVVWARSARRDLESLVSYLAQRSPQAALATLDPRVPILFVTADDSREGFRKGTSSGGDSYLAKPFSRAALKAALHVLTSMKRR